MKEPQPKKLKRLTVHVEFTHTTDMLDQLRLIYYKLKEGSVCKQINNKNSIATYKIEDIDFELDVPVKIDTEVDAGVIKIIGGVKYRTYMSKF